MKRLPPLALFGMAACWLTLMDPARAEAPSEVAQPAVTFEQISGEIARCDEAALKKLADLRNALEAEFAAGRLPDSVANPIKTWLGAIRSPIPDLANVPRPQVAFPEENQLVMTRLHEFEAEVDATKARRNELVDLALPEIEKRAVELARTAEKPSKIHPTAELARSLRMLMAVRLQKAMKEGTLGIGDAHTRTFWDAQNLLDSLDGILSADTNDDVQKFTRPYAGFGLFTKRQSTLISKEEIERIQRLALAPLARAIQEAHRAVDLAITGERPFEEVMKDIDRMEAAGSKYASATRALNALDYTETTMKVGIYKRIAEIAQKRPSQKTEDLVISELVVNGLRDHINAREKSAWDRLIQKWRDEWLAKTANLTPWVTKIDSVATTEALFSLAADAKNAELDAKDDLNPRFPFGLGDYLSTLAADWKTSKESKPGKQDDGGVLKFSPQPNNFLFPGRQLSNPDVELGMALHKLRERIARQLVSESCNLPELNQSPLNSETLSRALETLANRRAEAGEWREFLQVTKALAAYFPSQQARRIETGQAAGNYLAGLKFEKMEDWPQAVLAYETVLRTTASLAPVKESAERLKTILAKHPEFKEPSRSSPSTNVTHGS